MPPESLWKSMASDYSGSMDDYDMVLLGSDLEYLYHANDVGKKLPQDYGPLHLWLRVVKKGGSTSYEVPCDYLKQELFVQRVNQSTRIILHTSYEDDDNTISDVCNLGTTWTWAVLHKLNLNLNRINVDTKIKGDSRNRKPYCKSKFHLDQIPGSSFRRIKIYGGMPRADHWSYGDSELIKHLKRTIGTWRRIAKQNVIACSQAITISPLSNSP